MSNCCIKIELLTEGYEVEVPDFAEMAKKTATAKKAAGDMAPEPYMGNCTKEYACKTVPEVLKLVRTALESAPAGEYDAAFAEASAETD